MQTNEKALSAKEQKRAAEEIVRRRRTITVGLVTSFLFLAITLAFTPRVLTSAHPNYWGYAITVPIALVGLISAWLAWTDHSTTAGYLLIGTVLLLALATPIVGHGQGVSVGILVTILGISIAANTLPPKLAGRAVWLSVLAGVVVIILDQLTPDFGLDSSTVYTNVAVIALSIVFVVATAQRFETFALRTKLIIAFAAVMMLPLLILGIYNNYVVARILVQENDDHLAQFGKIVAERYDSFFAEQLNELGTEAKEIPLVDFLALAPASRSGSVEERKAAETLATLAKKNPGFISSYGILDLNGRNLLDTVSTRQGQDESNQIYFKQSIQAGKPYVSNVTFVMDPDGSVVLSAPILDGAGNTTGVLRAEYRAKILQSLMLSIAPNNPDIKISLVDRGTYLQLADTSSSAALLTTYKNFTGLELAALEAEGQMPRRSDAELLRNADAMVANGIDNFDRQPMFEGYSASLGEPAMSMGNELKSEPWIALATQSDRSELAATLQQKQNTIFISLALAALAILLAYLASQVLAAPLVSLTKIAEQISAGDITARATITTDDEIGALSNSFNRMTDELNQTLSTLEERVAERTADLEISRLQSERRANELTAIGEISKVISSEQRFDVLLPLIARLVSERFAVYHAGIFLLDETRQFAVLQAASSDGGRKMLAAGYRLQVETDAVVGAAAKSGRPRVALDVGEAAVIFGNPLLPGTRSEIALPLVSRGHTLGVLDVHSDQPAAFTEDNSRTLSILADQIAIAIENARLFQQTQQSLSEFESLYRQNIRQGWAGFTADEPLLGFRQTIAGGKKLLAAVENDQIRDALNSGELSVVQSSLQDEDASIVVPLKLRGQVIGTIRVQAPAKNRTWSRDEVGLAAAVAERLSLALENARLIQESRKQLIKEQTITDVTSKIGASIDLRNVLQTAVEELGRAMPGSEVQIRLEESENGKS